LNAISESAEISGAVLVTIRDADLIVFPFDGVVRDSPDVARPVEVAIPRLLALSAFDKSVARPWHGPAQRLAIPPQFGVEYLLAVLSRRIASLAIRTTQRRAKLPHVEAPEPPAAEDVHEAAALC
jgi:hypothetical protein